MMMQNNVSSMGSGNVLDDLLGGFGTAPVIPSAPALPQLIPLYDDSNITIGVSMKKDPTDFSTHLIRAFYQNKTSNHLTALNMQVAV